MPMTVTGAVIYVVWAMGGLRALLPLLSFLAFVFWCPFSVHATRQHSLLCWPHGHVRASIKTYFSL